MFLHEHFCSKVYPSYVYENKMEVSMHDGSSSTNLIDSSSRAVEVPCPTCPTGTFSSGQVENFYLLVLGQVQMN